MATDKLSAVGCKTYEPGKHFDGGGLFLLVTDTGARYWRLKYRHEGKEKTLALGVYPTVSLKEAREERDKAKKLIDAGTDPLVKRRDDAAEAERAKARVAAAEIEARKHVFSAIVEAYYEQKYRGWSENHRRDVRRIIDRELVPALGDKLIRNITRVDVEAMLKTIIDRGALTFAEDVRTYFRAIVAHFNGMVDDGAEMRDPSSKVILPEPPPEKHHAALSPTEIGPFLRALDFCDATPMVRIATRMMLLTTVRTTELRESTWDEFDLGARVWRIPESRMKGRIAHNVPLSRQVLSLLQELRKITGGKKYLFVNARDDDRPMSEAAILVAIKRMGYQGRLTGHGFRAMFGTWAREARRGYSDDAIEFQLAHIPKDKVRTAYLRSNMMDERAALLQDWADWLDAVHAAAANANVVELHQAA